MEKTNEISQKKLHEVRWSYNKSVPINLEMEKHGSLDLKFICGGIT